MSRSALAASGFPKKIGRLVLTNPLSVTAAEVDEHNEKLRTQGRWGRIVVASDWVIGVAAGGHARAYPTRYIQWHEIINDTLGELPIVVAYHPLCASAVAFDRRVGKETLEFGFSGLVYNSNLVMYDKRPKPADESLWCQLTFGPIAGPAVSRGDRLKRLPLFFGRWETWRKLHPDTTVFPGDERLKDHYKHDFQDYYRKAEIIFPVEPKAPADSPHKPFDLIRAHLTDKGWQVQPYDPGKDDEQTPDSEDQVFALWFAWQAIAK